MEDQIARHFYAVSADRRPAIAGKHDLKGAPLLPATGELTVAQVRRAIQAICEQIGVTDRHLDSQAAAFRPLEGRAQTVGGARARPAYFCSGCPHNTSTQIPDGSLALGGIGC